MLAIFLLLIAVGLYFVLSEPETLAESDPIGAEPERLVTAPIQETDSIQVNEESEKVSLIHEASEHSNGHDPLENKTVEAGREKLNTVPASVSSTQKTKTTQIENHRPKTEEASPQSANAKAIDSLAPKVIEESKVSKKKSVAANKPISDPDKSKTLVRAESVKAQAFQTLPYEPETLGAALSPQALDLQSVDAARKLEKSGERGAAIRLLRTFIENNEQDEYSRVALAKLLISDGRLAELYDLMVQVDQTSIPELREVKARCYAADGQFLPAVQVLKSALPVVSEYSDYYALLASYQQKLGAFEDSIATYSSLLEVDPERADWWLGMAIGFDRLKRYEDALLAYDAALKLPNLEPTLYAFASKRIQQLNP